MTWLLGKIIANPTVLLVLLIGVFTFGVTTGGSAAWWIQGLRITSAQQATKTVQQTFDKYQLDQKAMELHNKEVAANQREKERQDYEHLSDLLTDQINDGAVYKRCVAAGKCGVHNSASVPTSPGNGLQTNGGVDVSWSHSVPPGAGATTTNEDGGQCQALASDCAVTTLMLNRLQISIESQPGYPKE